MAEWPIAFVLKTKVGDEPTVGSNPTLPAKPPNPRFDPPHLNELALVYGRMIASIGIPGFAISARFGKRIECGRFGYLEPSGSSDQPCLPMSV